MITANQLRAARALLNIDQRQMAELADLSVPTIQRMEASDGVVRGNVDSLMKLVAALDGAGIELINPGVASTTGGRGVRLREHVTKPKTTPKPAKGKPKQQVQDDEDDLQASFDDVDEEDDSWEMDEEDGKKGATDYMSIDDDE